MRGSPREKSRSGSFEPTKKDKIGWRASTATLEAQLKRTNADTKSTSDFLDTDRFREMLVDPGLRPARLFFADIQSALRFYWRKLREAFDKRR